MAITITTSPESGVTTLENCCPVCETPVLPNDIFAGTIFIPFTLNMTDGTVVKELTVGGTGTVFNGSGIIELAEPAEEGVVLQVQVDDANCKATACTILVKPVPDIDCEAPRERPCHIRVVEATFNTFEIYAELSSFTVESYGALKYRLDNGEWKDSWTEIGTFTLAASHTIGIKSKDNPNCRISYPVMVVQKIISTPVATPTLTPLTPTTPTTPTPSTPITPIVITPSTPTSEVYKIVKCDGSGDTRYMVKSVEGLVGAVVRTTTNQCYTVISIESNVATHNLSDGYVNCGACLGVPPPSTPTVTYWGVMRCDTGQHFKTLTSAPTFGEGFTDGGGTHYVSLGSNYITIESDIGVLTTTGAMGCPP